MNEKTRTQEEIVEELKILTKKHGYIYSFCDIIINDSFFIPEELHKINHYEQVSAKESAMLLGFWVQNDFDNSFPKDLDDFLFMKFKTYDLLDELHHSFFNISEDMIDALQKSNDNIDIFEQKNIWKKEDIFVESIFYGGDGIYDYQYLDYLENKYKYDIEWLKKNKFFDINNSKIITKDLKNLIQKKSNDFNLKYNLKYYIRYNLISIKKEIKENESETSNLKREIEISTYKEFFNTIELKQYLTELFDLFVFTKSDINNLNDNFIDNFSISPNNQLNKIYNNIGNYNLIDSHPIIKLNDNKFFLPIGFFLFQAVYENPYYWMINDKNYFDIASNNRGKVGEEMFYYILEKIFSKENTFKTVKIKTKNDKIITDIDVLCILGNKALCVQIKSKKLTLLSKQGDIHKLENDFKEAFQESYEQGLKCRESILSKNVVFIDENNNELILNEQINECYIICGTTENYTSLTFQLRELLQKKESDPYPIAFSVFDLELIAYYLKDPYDFLYYIRQRISLSDYYIAVTEIEILGFHLIHKLYKTPISTHCYITEEYAQLIDRNYYPYKTGIKVSDKGDAIKSKYYNEDFEKLLFELKDKRFPISTDLIFNLLDLSGETRDSFIQNIFKIKNKTKNDKKSHNFSFFSNDNFVGMTFISKNNNNKTEIERELSNFCIRKKYATKANIWIGLANLIDSNRIVDLVYYDYSNWEYDEELEKLKNKYPTWSGQFIRYNKQGRNEPCYCGSGLKYKHCCGK